MLRAYKPYLRVQILPVDRRPVAGPRSAVLPDLVRLEVIDSRTWHRFKSGLCATSAGSTANAGIFLPWISAAVLEFYWYCCSGSGAVQYTQVSSSLLGRH